MQIAEKREAKGKEEKERYTLLNAEFQATARRDKKAFLSHVRLFVDAMHQAPPSMGFSRQEY